jgi:ribosomal protein S26
MRKALICFVLPLMLMALMGCEGTGGKAGPGSDKPCPASACKYCPETKALLGYEGTVHCDKCNKDMPAGKWCGKCNRFMLPGTVHCDKCNKDIPKGTYCAMCKMYVGVPDMAYCEHCKAPYVKADGCPGCKK